MSIPTDRVTLYRWDDIALEKVTDMLSRKIITGEKEMIGQIYLKKGALVPMHSHEAEQLTYVQGGTASLSGGTGADSLNVTYYSNATLEGGDGNVSYVGIQVVGAYVINTSAGLILIDTTYEKNVPTIAKSVEQLGFKFTDTKIILGNHAHGDHMEGDALAKEMTGAPVMAMAEDIPALAHIRPGGKVHPIDRVLVDGDTVSLGGVTLTAHLTPGHTHGCTTWTTTATEGGKT